jgi:hypothetical protein
LLKKKDNAKNGSSLSSTLVQQHIDKKTKLVHFTQRGLSEWLVKYSVLTDQSFLKVQHPVFVGMLEYIRPGIVLPNRKKLREKIIEKFWQFRQLLQLLKGYFLVRDLLCLGIEQD